MIPIMKRLHLLLGLMAFLPLSAQVPAQPLDPNQATPAPVPSTNQAPADNTPVLSIAAESSLHQVMQELAQSWADSRDDGPQIKLKLTNTGTLRTWAEKKEPYDLYLDASVDDVQSLTSSGALENGGQRLLASNRLAVYGRVAVEKDDELDWFDLVGTQWHKVALGNPDLTSLGRASVKALQKHDLWNDDNKGLYLMGETEKVALNYLQQEQADAVISYQTELANLNIPGFELYPVKATDAPPVFYTAAISHGAQAPSLALDFIKFCATEDARAIWRKNGFDPY